MSPELQTFLTVYSTFPLDITIGLKVNMSKMKLLIFPLKSTLPPASASQIPTPSFQSLMPKPLGVFFGLASFFHISHLIQEEILLT